VGLGQLFHKITMGMYLGNWPQDDCLLVEARPEVKPAKKSQQRREKEEKRRERSRPKFCATRAGHVYGSLNFLSAVQFKSA
jgi:hypothetical protein